MPRPVELPGRPEATVRHLEFVDRPMDVRLPAPEVTAAAAPASGSPAEMRLLVAAGDAILRCQLSDALRTLARLASAKGAVLAVRGFLKAWVHSYLGRPDAPRLATEAYAQARKSGSGRLQRAALTDLVTLLARHPDGQSPLARLQRATGIARWAELVPVAQRLVGELVDGGALAEAIWSLKILYEHRDTPPQWVFGAVARALELALPSGHLTDELAGDVILLGWNFPSPGEPQHPHARQTVARLYLLALRLAVETRTLRHVLAAERLRRFHGHGTRPPDEAHLRQEWILAQDLLYRAGLRLPGRLTPPSGLPDPTPRWYQLPPRRVYFGPVSYFPRGARSSDSLREAVFRSDAAVRRCFSEHVARSEGVRPGRLVLELLSGPARVETVRVVLDAPGDPELRRCVVGVYAALRLPEVNASAEPERALMRVPLVLSTP